MVSEYVAMSSSSESALGHMVDKDGKRVAGAVARFDIRETVKWESPAGEEDMDSDMDSDASSSDAEAGQ